MEDKKHKRKVKTPSQIEALEKFYNEHPYPSESMKLQLAESIGLTEKQVSGWFCHRRLKDRKLLNNDANAHGTKDRSSGVIQDRGSGLKQDSCGSTKQEGYKHFDPKEVESKRFTSKDVNYELGSLNYTRNYSGTDNTSSSSPPQNADPIGLVKSRNLTQNVNSGGLDLNGVKRRTGPSGYLKVKGQTENVAITAVKRQLGRLYREDGPPLGVEFEPLPPDAFESPITVPVNQPQYVGEPNMPHSSDGSRIYKQHNPISRYEGYSSQTRSHNSDLDETSFRTMHGVGQMRPDYVSSHHTRPYGGKLVSKQTDSQLRNHDDVGPMGAQSTHRESFESKPSSLTLKCNELLGLEDKGMPRRIAKSDVHEGDIYGRTRGVNENCDPVRVKINAEMRAAKRVRDEFRQQQYTRKASAQEISPWENQSRRPAADIPSSFSEDETAEASSSVDGETVR